MKEKPFEKPESPANGSCPKPTIGMELSETSKRLHDCLRKASEAAGLPQSYRLFLFHLEHESGLTQLELARRVKLSAPSVSVTLQKMERDGLLIRQTDEKDQRNTRVYLTEEGHALNAQVYDAVSEVDNRLIYGFTKEEQALFESMLKRMNENLEGMNL